MRLSSSRGRPRSITRSTFSAVSGNGAQRRQAREDMAELVPASGSRRYHAGSRRRCPRHPPGWKTRFSGIDSSSRSGARPVSSSAAAIWRQSSSAAELRRHKLDRESQIRPLPGGSLGAGRAEYPVRLNMLDILRLLVGLEASGEQARRAKTAVRPSQHRLDRRQVPRPHVVTRLEFEHQCIARDGLSQLRLQAPVWSACRHARVRRRVRRGQPDRPRCWRKGQDTLRYSEALAVALTPDT